MKSTRKAGANPPASVTRFSLKPGSEVAPAAPVQMRLLSQTDLVKILGNTYYADCDHSGDEPLGQAS